MTRLKTGWIRRFLLFLAFFVLFFVGCDQFVLWEELDKGTPEQKTQSFIGALSLAPASVTISSNSSLTFVAAGGEPPYTFSVTSGAGNINQTTGRYTAPPGAGKDNIRVTDSDDETKDATVNITTTGVLGISPLTVTLVANGSLTFVASGGISPYTFSIFAGTGSVDSGTGEYIAPIAPGSATVRVTDLDTPPSTADASITIILPASLTISPSAIVLDVNTSVDFEVFGGVAPYTYSIVAGAGSIDSGTGLYDAPDFADNITVRVTDSDSPPSTDDATVTIIEGLAIIPQAVSVPANNNVDFSASGGVPPYTYAMESGTGAVTVDGLYTAPGAPGADEVKVTDDVGSSRIAAITVTAPQPLNIIPSSLIILTNDNYTFSASGGTPLYTFSKVSGNGVITVDGIYTASGIPGIDVLRATDSLALTADAFVTIVDIGPLTIIPVSVTVEQNDSYTFSASGGTPLYTYSVIAGSGFVNSSTGDYTAPAILGTETVRVTDAALNTADATVNLAPAAPTDLIVDGTFAGPQEIQLTWSDNATGEDGFSIERKVSGGVYAEIDTVGANETDYEDGPGLSPDVPYSYQVRAYKLPGPVYSDYSNDDFDIPNS